MSESRLSGFCAHLNLHFPPAGRKERTAGLRTSGLARQAKSRGIGFKLGHDVLLTEAEVNKLAEVIVPRPRK